MPHRLPQDNSLYSLQFRRSRGPEGAREREVKPLLELEGGSAHVVLTVFVATFPHRHKAMMLPPVWQHENNQAHRTGGSGGKFRWACPWGQASPAHASGAKPT